MIFSAMSILRCNYLLPSCVHDFRRALSSVGSHNMDDCKVVWIRPEM